QFEEAYPGPYKYSVYINDEFLFDESSIEAGCAYSITPSESYTINVSVRYTYCLHGECAFSPQDFRTATYNETIQLEHLRNYRCNKLKMYGGWHDPDLEVRQDLGY
ncbi:MAG TPA: hypothetical protein VFG39_02860, partial [Balneolaceae bacterium]|nr:hypothetical protein [Balneolaceae bacterium]